MDKLTMLKMNLEISNTLRDDYLTTLLDAAEKELTRQGITAPTDSTEEDYMNLLVMYAAYFYRKRAEDTAAMPAMLRYARNNYLLHQKMKETQA